MKLPVVAILVLALALSLGGNVTAQDKITSTGTNYGSSEMKVLPLD